ncbi:hypothetical protein [Cupriavidus basilensis]|uniref:hypothetical protein n=1 Tax=Cupriavidus basilensis TaxID=68895 RepID=UPI003F5B5D1A
MASPPLPWREACWRFTRRWLYLVHRWAGIAGCRAYRWLFHAAHSWDFGWLVRHRPAWDATVWLLSLAGLVVSASGVVIGWRRLFRGRRRRA